MIRLWAGIFFLLLSASGAAAQNPTCPTRPPGDNSNACASTAFVQGAVPSSTAAANTVYAGPTSGAPGAVTFRALVGADLPYSSTTSRGAINRVGVNGYFTGLQFTIAASANTAPGSRVITFASVPDTVRIGMTMFNLSNPLSMYRSSIIVAKTATTVTIDNDTGGVTIGDSLGFYGYKYYKPDGTEVDQTGTTTGGLQEAVTAAIPNGFPLKVDCQTSRSSDDTYGDSVLGAVTPITIPPSLFAWMDFSTCNIGITNVVGTAPNGFIVDSMSLARVYWPQIIIYRGPGAAVLYKPTNQNPIEHGIFVPDTEQYFNAIVTQPLALGDLPTTNAIKVDLTSGDFFNNRIFCNELYSASSVGTGATLFVVTNQTAANQYSGNLIDCNHAHGFTDSAFQIGTSTSNQGSLFGNVLRARKVNPATGATTATGISTYETGSIIEAFVSNEEMGGGSFATGAVFNTGALNNVAVINLTGASGSPSIVNDGSGNKITSNGLTSFQSLSSSTPAIRIAQSNSYTSYWDIYPEESVGALDFYRNGDRIARLGNTGSFTLGKAAIGTGQINLIGTTSGVATLTTQAAAGTPTVTIGTNTGTLVSTATSPLGINAATGDISCGTCVVTNGSAQVTITNATFPPLGVIRTTSATNTVASSIRTVHQTSADAVDGLGSSVSFAFTDTGVSNALLGSIGGIRDGADTEGGLVFLAGTNGIEEFMRLGSAGGLSIGTTTAAGAGSLRATGTIRADTGFSANGTSGFSGTKTVRASGGAADCTLVYSFGLLIAGGTC